MNKETVEIFFGKKIEKTNSCWNWLGSVTNSGYGTIKQNGKNFGAHRFAYEISIGKIPDGLFVLHKCDNKRCVNPEHLWIGTQKDNMNDMIQKGRSGKPYRWTTENNPNTGKPMSSKNKKLMSQRKQKPFKIIDPYGKLIEGTNLTQFCKKNNLNQGAMWSVIAGKIRMHKKYMRAPLS